MENNIWKNNNLLDRYEEKLTPLLDGALVGLPGYAYIDSTGTYNNTSHGPRIKIAKEKHDLVKTGGASTTIKSDGTIIPKADYSKFSLSDKMKWSVFVGNNEDLINLISLGIVNFTTFQDFIIPGIKPLTQQEKHLNRINLDQKLPDISVDCYIDMKEIKRVLGPDYLEKFPNLFKNK